MRRSFRWLRKWPQLPFANGLQIDSVMDPLKGAAASTPLLLLQMEQKSLLLSWINETSEYHLSRTVSIRFLGGKKSWTGKAIKSTPTFFCLLLFVRRSGSIESSLRKGLH